MNAIEKMTSDRAAAMQGLSVADARALSIKKVIATVEATSLKGAQDALKAVEEHLAALRMELRGAQNERLPFKRIVDDVRTKDHVPSTTPTNG